MAEQGFLSAGVRDEKALGDMAADQALQGAAVAELGCAVPVWVRFGRAREKSVG